MKCYRSGALACLDLEAAVGCAAGEAPGMRKEELGFGTNGDRCASA
jgi:hypothetical protein